VTPPQPFRGGDWRMKRASEKQSPNATKCNSFQNARNLMTRGYLYKTASQTPPYFAIRHPRLADFPATYFSPQRPSWNQTSLEWFVYPWLTKAKASVAKESLETSMDMHSTRQSALLKELLHSANPWRSSARTGEAWKWDRSPAELQACSESWRKPLGLG